MCVANAVLRPVLVSFKPSFIRDESGKPFLFQEFKWTKFYLVLHNKLLQLLLLFYPKQSFQS